MKAEGIVFGGFSPLIVKAFTECVKGLSELHLKLLKGERGWYIGDSIGDYYMGY